MFAEIFDLLYSLMPRLAMVLPIFLFAVGLIVGAKLHVVLGPLLLLAAYGADVLISNYVVISYNLEMDRFPMNIETIGFGIIALGWVIGSCLRPIGSIVRRAKTPARGVGFSRHGDSA